MTKYISINMGKSLSKMVENEKNNADPCCKRMAIFMASENFKARVILACVDAVMASNGGERAEIMILTNILPRLLSDDFFSKKNEFQSQEILQWLEILSLNGILEINKQTRLVWFVKGLDPSALIKESLEIVEKIIGQEADDFAGWLSHICKQYQIEKESDEFKRAKKDISRGD